MLVLIAVKAMEFATENNLLPEELQKRMELQASNPYGILAAGRPDTVAALYGISKRPLIGYGSTNVDPEVYAYYLDLAWSSYIWESSYSGLLAAAWASEWTYGTPSHSHVFGAWVDAGILAALCWFAVIYLAVKIVMQMMLWRHPLTPLIVLVSIATVWDVLFSPGPHRMDIAIRLIILIHAAELLRAIEARPAAEAVRRPLPFRRQDNGGRFQR
jgi:O-antigen ligase